MSDSVHLVARALTSVVFIVFGYLQFTNIDAYTANPAIVRFASLTGGVIAPVVVAYLVAPSTCLADYSCSSAIKPDGPL